MLTNCPLLVHLLSLLDLRAGVSGKSCMRSRAFYHSLMISPAVTGVCMSTVYLPFNFPSANIVAAKQPNDAQ